MRDYLNGVYTTTLIKDVLQRENIRNTTLMMRLVSFLADNMGQLVSVSSISKYLKAQGENTNVPGLNDYLRCLKNGLIIDEVPRYNIHGKTLLANIAKYYFADLGLRNLQIDFNLQSSIEKVLEGAVYHHLAAHDCKPKVGVLPKGEIDFVAERLGIPLYVQAAYLLGDKDTIEREFGNLKKIDDNYPKMVISLDPKLGWHDEIDGVERLHLRDFLLAEL